MSSSQIKPPETESSEIIFNEYFKIKKDRLRYEQGDIYHYYTLLINPIAVMVLAMTFDGKWVINREYRHPTGQILLSCPGGLKEREETVLQCAQRELLEETGYEAKAFEIIGESYPFPGIAAQKTVFVKALQATLKNPPNLEKGECIETLLLTNDSLKDQIRKGACVDGLLCTALFFYSLLHHSEAYSLNLS
jgi:ADP-ribose pyrophosphatase